MDLLPPAGWGDLVRQPYVEAEFKALRSEMAEFRAELQADFKVLEGKVDSQVRQLAATMTTSGLVLAIAAHFS